MAAQLPTERDDEAFGEQMRSHYTTEENSIKPLDIEQLEVEREKRKKDYAQVAHDYYELVTPNLEFAWNKKFHFGPFLDNEMSISESLAAHDHYQFMCMGVKPGMRGLDAGCGIGEPARQYAKWADVHVTGITITQHQVDRANMHAEQQGVTDKVAFVRADFCKMPFPDNTFDFVYAHQATCHANELRDVYTEIVRVLKPGDTFSIDEWCMTDKFDPHNAKHVEIRQRIERGDGIVNLKTTKEALEHFKFSGAELMLVEDHALKGLASRPWWAPLDGDTSKFPDRDDWWMVFKLKPFFWNIVRASVWVSGKVGLITKNHADIFMEALNTQGQSVWGLRDGGREGIFTPSWLMIGRKPENWVHPQPDKAKEAVARVAAAAQEAAKSKSHVV